jgi:hypothetical protein
MADDIYTGCQPVFVPTSSVMELRGIIMLAASEEKTRSVLILTPAKIVVLVVVVGLCSSAAAVQIKIHSGADQFKNPLL